MDMLFTGIIVVVLFIGGILISISSELRIKIHDFFMMPPTKDSSLSLSDEQVSQIIERAIAKGGKECYLIFYNTVIRKHMTSDQANRGIEKLLSSEVWDGRDGENRGFNSNILHCAKDLMTPDQVKRSVDKIINYSLFDLYVVIENAPEHLDRLLDDLNSPIYKDERIYSVLKWKSNDLSCSKAVSKVIDKIIEVRTDAYQLLTRSIDLTPEQKRKVVNKWVEKGGNLEGLVRGIK